MKLANFKNPAFNANYGFDRANGVVVNRKSGKAMTWEQNGTVRLSVNGSRKRYTKESLVEQIVVSSAAKKPEPVKMVHGAKAKSVRSKIAEQINTGNTEFPVVYNNLVGWVMSDLGLQRAIAYNYIKNLLPKVLKELGK